MTWMALVWAVSMLAAMVIGIRKQVAWGPLAALGGLMAGFFFGPVGILLVLVSSRRSKHVVAQPVPPAA